MNNVRNTRTIVLEPTKEWSDDQEEAMMDCADETLGQALEAASAKTSRDDRAVNRADVAMWLIEHLAFRACIDIKHTIGE
jgi:chorismate-pyruvate lyase